MNVSSKTRGMDVGDCGGVRRTVGDVASLLLGSKWALALLTALAGNLALSLSAGYPLVLPGGAVASSPSILSLLASVALCLASGMLAPALARRVPVPLAMATCACLPVTAVLSPVTWGVPAFAVVPTVALACGALCWVLRRLRREGGVPVPSCVAALVGTALLVALLHAGGPMCARHPGLLATGYARAGEAGGHGIHGGLASSLCVSAAGAVGSHRCEGVVVSPCCTDFEGRLMSWGVGEGGGEVLLVASEYLGSYTVDELSDYARRMAESEGDVAFLYTRWLDGRIWFAMQGG